MPNPGAAVSYHRYAYVSWNPINRTDPTGHMDSEPDDGCGLTACIRAVITSNFKNVSIEGDEWSFDELYKVNRALMIASGLHGGFNQFGKAVGKFSIYKSNNMGVLNQLLSNISVFGIAPPGYRAIILSTALLSNPEAIFNIVHEIGHVFDFSEGNKKSDVFISNLSSNKACMKGIFLGCVNLYVKGVSYQEVMMQYAWLNSLISGYANFGYSPEMGFTAYGEMGSIDDFADSYAITAFQKARDDPGREVDSARKMIIAVWVDMTK